jgi:hypothetical protein
MDSISLSDVWWRGIDPVPLAVKALRTSQITKENFACCPRIAFQASA